MNNLLDLYPAQFQSTLTPPSFEPKIRIAPKEKSPKVFLGNPKINR